MSAIYNLQTDKTTILFISLLLALNLPTQV